MTTSVTKAQLYRLVDELPRRQLPTAKAFLEYLRAAEDPVLKALLEAPEGDEPLSPEDRKALEEGRSDLQMGRILTDARAGRRL